MNILLGITTADWINIVIASITLLTAIIALFTINEMRKQRVHSYFPDINMANFSFYVYNKAFDTEFSSVNLCFFKNKQEENFKTYGFNELRIGINNIGYGVAKNVRWDWNLDFKLSKEALCKDKSVKWKIADNALFIESNTLNIKWLFDFYEEGLGGHYNFILPYSIETRETEIAIPNYFISLYWLYIANQINIKEVKSIKENFPPAELNVTYTDIHSNRIKKTFSIYLVYEFVGLLGEKDKEIAELRFIIKEK